MYFIYTFNNKIILHKYTLKELEQRECWIADSVLYSALPLNSYYSPSLVALCGFAHRNTVNQLCCDKTTTNKIKSKIFSDVNPVN